MNTWDELEALLSKGEEPQVKFTDGDTITVLGIDEGRVVIAMDVDYFLLRWTGEFVNDKN